MFQSLQLKLQTLKYMFQTLEHEFQSLKHKIVLGEKTFSSGIKIKKFSVSCLFSGMGENYEKTMREL